MKVAHVMRTDVVTVPPSASLKEVGRLLIEHGISGLPVCDEEGRVLGVVSETDFLYKEQGSFERSSGPLAWLFDGQDEAKLQKFVARTAGEAMTAPAITIDPTRPVAEAARTMLEHGINRLPVVLKEKLVGIVTRSDLVRAFERPDTQIEREIREDVIRRTLWIGGQVDVEVVEGHVTLRGEVDTRIEAEMAEKLADTVPGVVSVTSELTWLEDDLSPRKARKTARPWY
jgi:CBS domain-containing protein